jgi:hypothetical protein
VEHGSRRELLGGGGNVAKVMRDVNNSDQQGYAVLVGVSALM